MRFRRGYGGLIVDEGRLSGLAAFDSSASDEAKAAADAANAVAKAARQAAMTHSQPPTMIAPPPVVNVPVSEPYEPAIPFFSPKTAQAQQLLALQKQLEEQSKIVNTVKADVVSVSDETFCADPNNRNTTRCKGLLAKENLFKQLSASTDDTSIKRKQWMLWIACGLLAAGGIYYFMKE